MSLYYYLGTNPNSDYAVVVTLRHRLKISESGVSHEAFGKNLSGGCLFPYGECADLLAEKKLRRNGNVVHLGVFPIILEVARVCSTKDGPLAYAVCDFEELVPWSIPKPLDTSSSKYIVRCLRTRDRHTGNPIPSEKQKYAYAQYDQNDGTLPTGFPCFGDISRAKQFDTAARAELWIRDAVAEMPMLAEDYDLSTLEIAQTACVPVRKIHLD